MNHTDPPAMQAPSARRRLIRGALAAPALMTICSGSAFAAASTRCLANAQTMPQPAPSGTTAPDTYLRVQLYKVTVFEVTPCSTATEAAPVVDNTTPSVKGKPKKRNDGADPEGSTAEPMTDPPCTTVDKFYVKGSDLGLYERGPGMPTNLQYLQIDPTNYQTIGAPVSPPAPAILGGPGVGSEGYVNQYAAVRFNSSGVVVGIGDASQGALLGTSCWASVKDFLP